MRLRVRVCERVGLSVRCGVIVCDFVRESDRVFDRERVCVRESESDRVCETESDLIGVRVREWERVGDIVWGSVADRVLLDRVSDLVPVRVLNTE